MKIFGNWKMYLDHNEAVLLSTELTKKLAGGNKDCEVAVFPSMLSLLEVRDKLASKVSIGAQNCAWVSKGAYTGEVSAHMLASVGCQYVLVGHSERRHVFGESNELVRKKLEAVLDAGLTPVLCIGETQEDKDEEKTQYRLKKQLLKALEGLKVYDNKMIIAYEPVWAIGSGVPCLPADADDVHGWIKNEVKQYLDFDIPVLYGGSVNSENVLSYVSLDTVDGVLIGGASVKLDGFVNIIKLVNNNLITL
ncbi:MAG: triose-phosphate isomerase [bacterium]|nr:triose-phosphate isomerase [bacterium]